MSSDKKCNWECFREQQIIQSVGRSRFESCHVNLRSVAQPGRASALGAEGRRFKSYCSDYIIILVE